MDGSEQLSLSSSAMHFDQGPPDPQWSPDGKWIAFTDELPNSTLKIYLVAADGGTPPVEAIAKETCYWPSWSPDGISLIFNCDAPSTGPERDIIYILNLRTRQLSALPESTNMYRPHFSPDGRSVVAHDEHQISLFDLGQGKWQTLVKIELPEHDGFHPPPLIWSRDGRYVYFVTEGKEASIYRLRIADRNLEKLANLQNIEHPAAATWFSLAPDDSPLILRDVGTNEIYALDWDAP